VDRRQLGIMECLHWRAMPINDWRRELALMNGAIDAAIERQGGE